MKKNFITRTVLTGLLCAALTLGLTGCGSQNQSAAYNTYPEFSTTNTDGGTVTHELFKDNKITLLSYWATTCGYCIDEMPHLEAIASEYADQGVGVKGIVMNPLSDQEEVVSILEAAGATYENIYGTTEMNQNVTATPALYVVDADGNVLLTRGGLLSEEKLKEIIDHCLSKVN